jgi:hypothetical protein
MLLSYALIALDFDGGWANLLHAQSNNTLSSALSLHSILMVIGQICCSIK